MNPGWIGAVCFLAWVGFVLYMTCPDVYERARLYVFVRRSVETVVPSVALSILIARYLQRRAASLELQRRESQKTESDGAGGL